MLPVAASTAAIPPRPLLKLGWPVVAAPDALAIVG
jgi:hypothetical protein